MLKDVEQPGGDGALRLGEEPLSVRPVDGVLGEERVGRGQVQLALVAHRVAHRVEAGQAGDRHYAGMMMVQC